MDDSHPSAKTSARLASDVRAALERWAHYNLSSVTTELNRCVRERIQRERKQDESEAAR
jgi:hypothetical protein